MARKPNTLRERRWSKLKRAISCEVYVIATGLAAFAGAASFFTIVQKYWHIGREDWWILALVSTLFSLPETYKRIRRLKAPLLIKAAHAFRYGFVALQTLLPNFSTVVNKARGIWKHISNSP